MKLKKYDVRFIGAVTVNATDEESARQTVLSAFPVFRDDIRLIQVSGASLARTQGD